jgi:enoyl-CoA hydratase
VPERDAMRLDSEIGMRVFMSDDAKEGPRAFMEKRTPMFEGH